MAKKQNSRTELHQRLSGFAELRNMVCLTRMFSSDPRHNGFVLGVSRKLVLFQTFHDFYPEGYTVLRLEDIKNVSAGRHERFFERMFKGEGLLDRVGIAYTVPINDLRAVLQYLSERGMHVVLECELTGSDESDYYIGRLVSVSDEKVELLYVDSLGKWNKEPSVISSDSITKIEFDTPYINTFSKYIKAPGQTRNSLSRR
jgi:hypothetical protein